ncbi:MAG: hypothetical protein ACXADB_08915 [Candidatus Hermodarchaeia archaeon]|jgi:hypothetical protein
MSRLKRYLRKAYYWIKEDVDPKTPVVEGVPDFNMHDKVEREEYFHVAYMSVFLVLFFAYIYFTPDLIDLMLDFFPSVGPIPAFWIVHIAFGFGILFLSAMARQVKIGYERKLDQRVNAYPVMTGTITEMEEEGYTIKYFQMAIQDIRQVATGGQEVQLHTNPGDFKVNHNDNMYIITTAYTKEKDILHQFPVITEHKLDDHLALKRFEDVYFGWVGVRRQVSKIHFVVPQRTRDQRPIMYVGHSAVTVDQVMKRQHPKPVNEDEIYAVERLYALTQGERLQQQSVQERARIRELSEQNKMLRLQLYQKQQEEKKKSVVFTPEKEKVPIIGLTGWKLYAFYIGLGLLIVLALIFGSAYFGVW